MQNNQRNIKFAILAAGEGSRLAQEGVALPKPLVQIHGEAMIDRLIRIFMDCGAKEILIITNNLMGANIPGELEGSVMSTNRDFVTVENMQIQGHYVQEARGFWEMTKDVMGGPFVAHSQVDTINNRVIVVEGFVYAPDKMKRTMMRRLEAALYTLKLPGKEESEE